MTRIIVIILVLAALLFPLTAAAEANIPAAAECIGEQLDDQLMARFDSQGSFWGKSERQRQMRMRIMIMGTTPANINNLNQTSPLARQMTEEISRWLVNRGYRYSELQKGKYIRFDQGAGEFILTRNVPQLASQAGAGQAILAGTYVRSGEDVRFSISLISTSGNQVLAKATATVPITPDLLPMLVENSDDPRSGLKPSVYTRLK